MKIKFEELDYQIDAIKSITDLFKGQEECKTEFTLFVQPTPGQAKITDSVPEIGVGNEQKISDEELLINLNEIQERNGLVVNSSLKPLSDDELPPSFSIDMETGTGKTYVYLRSIFELNKLYGFTKFIIVVPSIAIKEGVFKSLKITEEHFRSLYAGTPLEYFIYDSGRLDRVRNFAVSPHIQVMVMTVGAINKKNTNKIYEISEKAGGYKPVELIQSTNPILIVDEPQSVDGGLQGKGKEALESLSPLCTLRFSATHIDKYPVLYRLDPVDAYEQELVKQIEISSAMEEGVHNSPYIQLLGTEHKGNSLRARVELDVNTANGIERKEKVVDLDTDFEDLTGLEIYSGMEIIEINSDPPGLNITYNEGENVWLSVGEHYGGIDHQTQARVMIRRTIQSHLDKELKLNPKGIKVLSLFFIDKVSNYRSYSEEGLEIKGLYAEIFEEEMENCSNIPKYSELFVKEEVEISIEASHNGYFSIDRNQRLVDTSEGHKSGRASAQRAYELIMRNQEELITLENPMRFLFSHSALKEGWDNPNVFQICTLREMSSQMQRRQTIGRGMRICRNQEGDRVHGFDVNTLTVVATESYEDFARFLQHEIEEETGFEFGVVSSGTFGSLNASESKLMLKHLQEKGQIDTKGKAADTLSEYVEGDDFTVPDELSSKKEKIKKDLKKVSKKVIVKKARDRKTAKVNNEVLECAEFQELWNRIKQKTTYSIELDQQEFIDNCIDGLNKMPRVKNASVVFTTASIGISQSGLESTVEGVSHAKITIEHDLSKYDIIGVLERDTGLKRSSIVEILTDCKKKKLGEFKKNPQHFLQLAKERIVAAKELQLVNGIMYDKRDSDDCYSLSLYTEDEMSGYSDNMIQVKSKKCPLDYVKFDSEVEKTFVEDCEKNTAVIVYTKLPRKFVIPTPLGPYNPDWALLIQNDGGTKLYFVAETKSTLIPQKLRPEEQAKIDCATAHFTVLSGEGAKVHFQKATKLEDIILTN